MHVKIPQIGGFYVSGGCVLHRAALFAGALVADAEPDGREADQHVNEPLYLRPGAEDHVDHVPVGAGKPAKADEAPVESADDK